MSADNMICVQKRGNRWWVWMGFASEKEHKPAKCDAKFYEEKDAELYAMDWESRAYVQYGVVRLAEA